MRLAREPYFREIKDGSGLYEPIPTDLAMVPDNRFPVLQDAWVVPGANANYGSTSGLNHTLVQFDTLMRFLTTGKKLPGGGFGLFGTTGQKSTASSDPIGDNVWSMVPENTTAASILITTVTFYAICGVVH